MPKKLIFDTDVRREIQECFEQWIAAVTSGRKSAPDDVLVFYDEEASLWATFSPERRNTPDLLREYFVRFTGLSGLQADVVESDILVFDSFAVNRGLYTFSYEGSGERVSVPARFSFTYIRREEGWRIIEHHSSRVPEPLG